MISTGWYVIPELKNLKGIHFILFIYLFIFNPDSQKDTSYCENTYHVFLSVLLIFFLNEK